MRFPYPPKVTDRALFGTKTNNILKQKKKKKSNRVECFQILQTSHEDFALPKSDQLR